MPGPYTTALKSAITDEDSPALLSFALLTREQLTFADRNQLLPTYASDPSSYTACHDVATELLGIIGDGTVSTYRDDQAIAQAKSAVLMKNSVIQIQHFQHSVVLIAGPDGVESLEAWAGSSSGAEGSLVVCRPLWETVFNDPDHISVGHAEVAKAIGYIGNASKSWRSRGLNTISRAGGADAFEKGGSDTVVKVSPLRSIPQVELAMQGRVNTARPFFKRGRG